MNIRIDEFLHLVLKGKGTLYHLSTLWCCGEATAFFPAQDAVGDDVVQGLVDDCLGVKELGIKRHVVWSRMCIVVLLLDVERI